jgi:peptidoglycan/LPS O-acetylase OafA/YrhL
METDGDARHRRLKGMDGLRAVAACSVLVLHCWSTTKPNFWIAGISPVQLLAALMTMGVALFFSLSGFLLYRPWAKAILEGKSLPSLLDYALRRVLRIVPAYLVILFLAAYVLATTTVERTGHRTILGPLTDPATMIANMTLTQNARPATASTGIMPAWSLAIEACFYLVLPLLGLLAVQLVRRMPATRAVLAPPGLLLVVGLAGKMAAAYALPGAYNFPASGWHYVLETSFVGHADEFSFGMLVAVLYHQHANGTLSVPTARTRYLLEIAGLTLSIVLLSTGPAVGVYLGWTAFAALYAALIGFVVMRRPRPLVGALERRPVVALGLISYSIFLWNQPVAFWLHDHGFLGYGLYWLVPNLLLTFAVVVILSSLTYRLVEAPAMGWRSRDGRFKRPAVESA